jgi:hypothetical protein
MWPHRAARKRLGDSKLLYVGERYGRRVAANQGFLAAAGPIARSKDRPITDFTPPREGAKAGTAQISFVDRTESAAHIYLGVGRCRGQDTHHVRRITRIKTKPSKQ